MLRYTLLAKGREPHPFLAENSYQAIGMVEDALEFVAGTMTVPAFLDRGGISIMCGREQVYPPLLA